MRNTIILILIIVLVLVVWVLYFYKNTIKSKYNNNSGKVKETISNAAKQVKEDIKS